MRFANVPLVEEDFEGICLDCGIPRFVAQQILIDTKFVGSEAIKITSYETIYVFASVQYNSAIMNKQQPRLLGTSAYDGCHANYLTAPKTKFFVYFNAILSMIDLSSMCH
jgi:hypothetical protein